jgi:predicted transcriptional regulator
MANTNNKKMTQADHFNALLTYLDECPDIVFHSPKGDITAKQMADFATRRLELLDKKNSSDKKPTAQQEANAVIKTAILKVMEDGKKRTITDLLKDVEGLPEGMTNQRMSALVRQMVEAGLVVREEDKRKAYFFIAG